jgi:VIT1/CCC1 family predicted Fe2+/Mn2+ transporter
MTHHEMHRSHRVGWLRASVLGANDGIVSTASLIIGFVAAGTTQENVLLAGIAGLVAGAMSMAAGEYVSVSSQLDTEKADIELEKQSLQQDYEFELDELAEIYEQRGLDANLARQVAEKLMEHNALEAHLRDEIGISEITVAKPIQAAFFSALSFSVGAALPLIVTYLVPESNKILFIAASSLLFLGILGALAAKAGGANLVVGFLRVVFWGASAMALTALVGRLFNVAI